MSPSCLQGDREGMQGVPWGDPSSSVLPGEALSLPGTGNQLEKERDIYGKRFLGRWGTRTWQEKESGTNRQGHKCPFCVLFGEQDGSCDTHVTLGL